MSLVQKKYIVALLVFFSSVSVFADKRSTRQVKGLSISALVEVEAFFEQGTSGGDLAKVEIFLDKKVNNKVEINILFLKEGTAGALDIAEATIAIGIGSFMLTAGKMVVPFGCFETAVISDPMTLEMAETKETIIQLSSFMDGINYSAYVFSGNALTNVNKKLDGFGLAVDGSAGGVNWGAGFINNIADSDAIEGIGTNIKKKIGGLAINASMELGEFSLGFENITALSKFDTTDLGGSATADTPSVTAFDVGYQNFGLSIQSSNGAGFTGINKSVTRFSYSMNLAKGVGLGIELSTAKDYVDVSSTSTLLQLATKF